jgi:RNA ligase (TIGR02306 family)
MNDYVKLVTINEILPIENADLIELCKIDGWQCVTQKGNFQVGDQAIYVGIDSVIPDDDRFGDLKDLRIKTKKLRGCLSQGVLFPLNIINNLKILDPNLIDLSELLGITHYEKPIPAEMSGLAKGNFPNFIPKTDKPRIQNHMKLFEEFPDEPLYVTIKEDGTSFTCYIKDGQFGVCSRNLELKPPEEGNESNTYWKLAKEYDLENKMKQYKFDFALQGEMLGPKICGNKAKYEENLIKFFNAYNISEQRYMDFSEFLGLIANMNLESVDLYGGFMDNNSNHYVHLKDYTLDELIEHVNGLQFKGTQLEGLVFRSLNEKYSQTLQGRLSFKLVNNKYLLKNNE